MTRMVSPAAGTALATGAVFQAQESSVCPQCGNWMAHLATVRLCRPCDVYLPHSGLGLHSQPCTSCGVDMEVLGASLKCPSCKGHKPLFQSRFWLRLREGTPRRLLESMRKPGSPGPGTPG